MNDPNADEADEESGGLVETIYALRQAAIDHGLALAKLQAAPSGEARDQLLDTQLVLEEKTAATIDSCGEADGPPD